MTKSNSSNDKIRVGVVGVGHMGRYHAGVYHELDEVDLVAVADVDQDRAQSIAKQYDTRPLHDYRDMIGLVDAVSIVVPTSQHYPVAREFLNAGVHILIEKPIAIYAETGGGTFPDCRRTETRAANRSRGAIQRGRAGTA